MLSMVMDTLPMVTDVYPMVTDVYLTVAKKSSVANPQKIAKIDEKSDKWNKNEVAILHYRRLKQPMNYPIFWLILVTSATISSIGYNWLTIGKHRWHTDAYLMHIGYAMPSLTSNCITIGCRQSPDVPIPISYFWSVSMLFNSICIKGMIGSCRTGSIPGTSEIFQSGFFKIQVP
jgi:hypothetical protein